MLGKSDVDRIIETAMQGLALRMVPPHFTDPNTRTVVLEYNGVELSSIEIDIRTRPEYKG